MNAAVLVVGQIDQDQRMAGCPQLALKFLAQELVFALGIPE